MSQKQKIQQNKILFRTKYVIALVLIFANIGFGLPFGSSSLLGVNTAQATIAKLINFQGKLTKVSDGTNVSNATYAFEFKLYAASSGGSPLWTETYDQPSGSCAKLSVTNGIFNTKLGSCNPFTGVDFTTGSLYLSVNFAPTGTSYDGEMSPRKQLVASAFAFVANGVSGDGVVNNAVQSATALSTGRTSANPALQVDTNTASSVTGLKVTAAAAGSGTALTVISSGANEFLTIDAKGSGDVRIGGSSTGDILLGGGSSSTGCTITNSTGNLTCSGSVTGASTGTFGYWTRTGTLLTPATSGDTLSVPGAGTNSEVFGVGAVAYNNGVAVGKNASTGTGADNTVIGYGAAVFSGDTHGVAIGSQSLSTDQAIAIGYLSNVNTESLGIGTEVNINGNDTVAVGNWAQSSGDFAVALGVSSQANATSSIALGASTHANFLNSIAIGRGATTTTSNQLVIGASSFPIQDTYVGNGVINSSPTGFTLHATGGSGTNIAGASLTLAGGIGTGTGVGGNIVFQYAPAGSTGSSLNTLQTACSISGSNGSLSCPGTGTNSQRFGSGSVAGGTTDLAVGYAAQTDTAGLATAIGSYSFATENSVAVGSNALAAAGASVVLGEESSVSSGNGAFGIAIGTAAYVDGNAGIAIGYAAYSSAISGIAIGGQATAGAHEFVAGYQLGGTDYSIDDVYFGNGSTNTSPTGYILHATGGSGTNIAGANLTVAAGKATGNAASGDIIFQGSTVGSSGTTLQSLATRMIIKGQTGKVGIGTTSPDNLLTVNGTSNFTGNLAIGPTTQVNNGSGSGQDIVINTKKDFNASIDEAYGIYNDLTFSAATTGMGIYNGISIPNGVSSMNSVLGSFYYISNNTTGYVSTISGNSVTVTNTAAGTNDEIKGYMSDVSASNSSDTGALWGYYAVARASNNAHIYNAYGLDMNVTTSTGGVIDTYTGVNISQLTKGTNNVGIAIAEATGTKQTNLLIGTTTQPAGSYSIYNSSTDNNYFAGKLGIATTAPDKPLEVNSATGAGIRITYNDADGSATNYSDFSVSSGGDLTIAPSGGDTNITGNLIVSSLTSGGTQCLQANSSGVISGTGSACGAGGGLTVGTTAIASGGANRILYENGSTTLSSSSNFTYDATTLAVTTASTTASNKTINISQTGATSGTDYAGYFSNTGAATTNVGLYSTATGATNNYAAIFDQGNVGIGITTPGNKLWVSDNTTNPTVTIENTNAVGYAIAAYRGTAREYTVGTAGASETGFGLANKFFVFDGTVSATRLVIDTNGLMGIGTNAPGKQLDINSATGNNLRLTYNDTDGSAANYADLLMSSGGDLTIAPSGSDTAITGQLDVSGHLAAGANSAVNDGSLLFSGSTYNTMLSLQESYTNLTATDYVEGITNYMEFNPTAHATTEIYGIDNELVVKTGNNKNIPSMYGNFTSLSHNGTGAVTTAIGQSILLNNSAAGGTITTARGLQVNVVDNGTNAITNATGIRVLATSAVNSVGINIDQTVGTSKQTNLLIGTTTQPAGSYSIYNSSTDNNYFAGNLGVGDSSPNSLFTVGSGDLFQVNSSGAIAAATGITSSGTINFSGLSASSAVYTDGSKNLTTTTPSSGTIGYWSRSGTTLSTANANDVITVSSSTANATAVYATVSATTGTNYAGNFQATGAATNNVAMYLNAANATNNYALQIASGNISAGSSNLTVGPITVGNGTATANVTGVYSGVSSASGSNYAGNFQASGAATNNTGLYVSATGATNNKAIWIVSPAASANNYAIYDQSGAQSYFAGNVGIGDTSPNSLFTVGNGDLFQINSSGQIGSQQAPVSDYLFALNGNTTNDNSRIIDIVQTNDSGEDNSRVINVSNTSNIGTISNVTKSIYNITTSIRPTASIISTSSIAWMQVVGNSVNVDLSTTTLGTGTAGTQTVYGYSDQVMSTFNPVINDTDAGGSNTGFGYGVHSTLSGSPILTSVSSTTTFNTYSGYFTNSATTTGNANLTYNSYGVYGSTTGNLTTTGTTTHYAGYFSATGTADINYGIYSTVSGATTNYAAILTGGNVGIGTTVPDKPLEVNSATGAGIRITYNDADGSATNYSDFSVSSGGDLTIAPSGGDTNITGNLIVSSLTSGGTQCLQANSSGVISGTGSACGAGGGGMSIGGSITSATAGSVLFAGAAGVLAQNNNDFFWDNTNKRLGINTTAAPSASLHVVSSGAKTVADTASLVSNTSTSSTASIDKIGLRVSSTGSWTGTSANNIALKVDPATGGTQNMDIFSGPNAVSLAWAGGESFGKNYFSSLNASTSNATMLVLNESNSTSSFTQYGVFGSAVGLHASGTRTRISGMHSFAYQEGDGNVTQLLGYSAGLQSDTSGTVSIMAAFKADTNYRSAGTVSLNSAIYLDDQSGVANTAANNYQIYSNTTSPFVVRADGNVGIGLIAPTGLLHVRQTADSTNTSTPIALSVDSIGSAGELTAASGNQIFAQIAPVINQSATGSYRALDVNVTETTTSNVTGLNRLADLRVGGSSKLAISNNGSVTLQNASGLFTSSLSAGTFQNHLVRSDDFATTWTTSSITAFSNDTQIAPDGSTSAESLATSGSGGYVQQDTSTATSSTDYTFSVWARSTSGTQNFSMRIDGTTGGTGTEVTHTATTSWQRFSITQTLTGGFTGNVRVRIYPGTSASTGTIYAWGAQLEKASNVNGYAKTTTAALTNYNRGSSIYSNLDAATGFSYGNRNIIQIQTGNNIDATYVGQLIRVIDNDCATDCDNTTKGLEVQAFSGTNLAGINMGIDTYGYTFGLKATTTAQASNVAQPAAIFADLDNGSATTTGNAIRAYTDNATSANLVSIYQETSAYTGTLLALSAGNNSGSFDSGNFLNFTNNDNTPGTRGTVFNVDYKGLLTVSPSDADNTKAIVIDTEESTAGQSVFEIVSDVTTNDSLKLHAEADGSLFVSLSGTQTTVALCHANNGQVTNDEIVDCSGAPSDVAEYFGTRDASIEAAEVVVGAEDATPMHLDGMHTSKAWVNKTSKPYDNRILGVISTSPAAVYGDEIFSPEENPRPVALVGRVPVKVSLENGPIQKGDYLTSSSTPGFAMKSTRPGMVIGQALSGYDGNGEAKVMVFVNPFYYDPSVIVDNNGNVQLQRGSASTSLVANTNGQSAYLVNQEGSGNILQLQQNGMDRFLVKNNGSVNINVQPVTDQDLVLEVKAGDKSVFSVNAKGSPLISGAIVIKDDTFAGSVTTNEEGLAEITFSYNLGTGKPVVQLTAESQIPVFVQIVDFKKDENGNYTGFVMKSFDLLAGPVKAIVHYNVTGKEDGYITSGDQLQVAPNSSNSPMLIIDNGQVVGGDFTPINPDDVIGVIGNDSNQESANTEVIP